MTKETAYGVIEADCLDAFPYSRIISWIDYANSESSRMVIEQLMDSRLE